MNARQPPSPQVVTTSPRRFGGGVGAFTLIELLIVISIVAVLIALTFPAVRGTLGAARGFRCQSSQRTISFDFSVFADDELHGSRGNDETDMASGLFRIETFIESQYGVDEFWTYPLVPTYRVPDTQGRDPMRCAEVRGPVDLRRGASCVTGVGPNSGAVQPANNISFGFNVRMHYSESRAHASLPFGVALTTRILDGYGMVSPSSIPLMVDVDGRVASSRMLNPLLTGPSLGATTLLTNDRFWFPAHRHNGGVNVAFVDGHVVSTRDPVRAGNWGFEPPQPR